jgi:hypothetical protein
VFPVYVFEYGVQVAEVVEPTTMHITKMQVAVVAEAALQRLPITQLLLVQTFL